MGKKGKAMTKAMNILSWVLFGVWAVFAVVFVIKLHTASLHPLQHDNPGGLLFLVSQAALWRCRDPHLARAEEGRGEFPIESQPQTPRPPWGRFVPRRDGLKDRGLLVDRSTAADSMHGLDSGWGLRQGSGGRCGDGGRWP